MAKNPTPYQKKFLDPRWQKKRLDILNRDNFSCQRCGNAEKTLHVHHRHYLSGKEPWDYPAKLLVTLCEECHEQESGFLRFAPNDLSNSFLAAGFMASDFISIIDGLSDIELQHSPEVVLSVYGWALSSKKIQSLLIKEYFNELEEKTAKRVLTNLETVDDEPF